MRQLVMIVMALTMFAAMAAAAQAESIQGAPIKQGNKCWKFSPGGGIVDNRWGSWVNCPQTASVSVASSSRAARRQGAASR